MFYSCGPAPSAGRVRKVGGTKKGFCIDLHCHLHNPAVEALVQPVFQVEREPGIRFQNALSREVNRQQGERVRPQIMPDVIERRLRDMDLMGVDVQVISTSPFHFNYWLEPELAAQCSRLVNDTIAEVVSKHPDRFCGLGHVPLQSEDLAVEMLVHGVKELGFRGVEIGTNVAGKEVSRGLDRFWAKVQELDVVVFMHPNGFTGGERLADHYFNNVIGNPLDTTVALGHLVFDGIFERFPRLKLISAHGGGYASHYPARMDHVFAARADGHVALKRRPRASLAKVYFDTIVFDREQLRHLVNLWGADHIVVGTDYPYDMGSYDPHGFLDGAKFLKASERLAIKSGNAARLLKLSAKELAKMGRRK